MSQRNIKFLLVDDLEANLVALEALLKRDGLELLKARSGTEALELLLVHEVALALIDVQMPGMGGFELAETMRSTERTRTVPIIFLTAGSVDQQRRIRGYETGAVDFLPKPIDPENLLIKAATFYELARQREELRESEARLRALNEQLEQRNAELAQADRSKDEFVAMLAHELRNPLAPLRTATEILQHPKASPEERSRVVELLRRQIENMSHMLDDLLDVARITERKIDLKRKVVGVKPLLEAAVAAWRPMCEGSGQTLALTVPQSPAFLYGDPTRLEQIFGNLIGNACKYSGSGSHIVVEAEPPDADGIIAIHVRDNGKGISRELLPRIFDLFVQGSRTLDRTSGGLGIGLTVVHRLVTLHGGTIEAHSRGEGSGTTFTVRLPSHVPAVSPEISEMPSPGLPRSLRMLIVDDNRDSADSMALLQSMRGHETSVAYDGNEALEVARGFRPDVVLLDLGLPGMDGFEVARQLRHMMETRPPLMVALTGYGSGSDRQRAKEAGFDEHLVKPADPVQIERLLEQRMAIPAGH